MTAESDVKDYINKKVDELKDMFATHEQKDHEAFSKIFDAIRGHNDAAMVGITQLDSVLKLVKDIHDKLQD